MFLSHFGKNRRVSSITTSSVRTIWSKDVCYIITYTSLRSFSVSIFLRCSSFSEGGITCYKQMSLFLMKKKSQWEYTSFHWGLTRTQELLRKKQKRGECCIHVRIRKLSGVEESHLRAEWKQGHVNTIWSPSWWGLFTGSPKVPGLAWSGKLLLPAEVHARSTSFT